MNGYTLRSKKDGCAPRDGDASPIVDLTFDSDNEDSRCSSNPPTCQFITSSDGCVQSLSTTLEASLPADANREDVKAVKVMVKWSAKQNVRSTQEVSDGEKEGTASSVKDVSEAKVRHATTQKKQRPIQSESPPTEQNPLIKSEPSSIPITITTTYEVGEKIFACDKGVLYEARVCKQDAKKKGITKYLVHYLGYKKSHDRWLTSCEMLKRTQGNIGAACDDDGSRMDIIGAKVEEDVNDQNHSNVTANTSKQHSFPRRLQPGKSDGRSQNVGMRFNVPLGDDKTPYGVEASKVVEAGLENHGGQAIKIDEQNHRVTAKVNTPQDLPTRVAQARKAAVKVPKVGMRVSVLFEDGKTYGGKITKILLQCKKEEVYYICILYDDGKEEDTVYPDPDITLDSETSCCGVKMEEIETEQGLVSRGVDPRCKPKDVPTEVGDSDKKGQRSKVDARNDSITDTVNKHHHLLTRVQTEKAAIKKPKVGMSVGVRFDKDEVHSGKVTKVSERSKKKDNQMQNQEVYIIRILYDDGDVEDLDYPHPDILLNPRDESTKNNSSTCNDPEIEFVSVSEAPRRKSLRVRVLESRTIKENDRRLEASQSNEGNQPISRAKSGEGDATESNKRVCKKKEPPKDDKPEVVTSKESCTVNTVDGYDEDDYANLHRRYLMPRIREKVELAGGITLRRQCKGRMIDHKSRGFRLLRSKVDALLRKKDRVEVYRLLCQLRNWELDPRRVPAVFQDGADDDVAEVLDLTKEEEDGSGRACIDVDEYIADVLLGAKKGGKLSPSHTPSNSLPEVTSSSQHTHQVSFDDNPTTACNQSSAESISDSSDFQEDTLACKKDCHLNEEPVSCNVWGTSLNDDSAIPKAHQVQITCCGIEEIEAYTYAVIETVSKGAGFSNGQNSTCNNGTSTIALSILSHAASTMENEAPRPTVTQKPANASQEATVGQPSPPTNSDARSLSAPVDLYAKDIRKPQGQLTIQECREFYVTNTYKPMNASPQRATILHQPPRNSDPRSIDTPGDLYRKNIRWNDIPKPPGQMTIDECRELYVRRQARKQSHHQSRAAITFPTQHITDRGLGPLPFFGYDHATRPSQCNSLYGQHNQPTTTDGCNTFIQQSTLLPLAFNTMPAQHSGVIPSQVPDNTQQHLFNLLAKQNEHAFAPVFPGIVLQNDSHLVTTQNDFDFASTLSHMMLHNERQFQLTGQPKEEMAYHQMVGPPIPEQRVEKQPYSKMLPPNVEGGSCESLYSDMQPASPTNDRKKPRVAQVVTPEVEARRNALATLQKQKPQRKKRKQNAEGNPRKKLQFSTPVKTKIIVHYPRQPECRFSIADFGFPSDNKIAIKGDRHRSTLAFTSSKREERWRQLNSITYHSNKRRRGLHHAKPTISLPSFSIIPSSRIAAANNTSCDTSSLHEDWKKQLTRRRNGQWTPNGHITGRWKAPPWASNTDLVTSNTKPASCRKSLLPKLDSLVSNFMDEMQIKSDSSRKQTSTSGTLQDVICPRYVKPTFNLLRNAHSAMRSLLPEGDCEDWNVVQLGRRYYNYWRPQEVKVILLAESHAFTPKDRALYGPGLCEGMLPDTYMGPRGFISLVYCLAYGENESLSDQMNDKANRGTSQFWTLFAACARGVEHVATTNSSSKKSFSAPFAADLLKGGGLPVEERLKAKLEVLEDLRRRGIWLLDASIFGWYISQRQEYSRSSISHEVHRKQKQRPPMELKVPHLVLSWELFTKHLIREVAEEGHLKLLIPIGKEVESALTRERMEDAIRGKSEARVTGTFPAPNAWIPGGYGPFHAKLAALVNEEAPGVGVKADED